MRSSFLRDYSCSRTSDECSRFAGLHLPQATHRERGNDPKESVIECNEIKRVGCFKLREWLKPNEKLQLQDCTYRDSPRRSCPSWPTKLWGVSSWAQHILCFARDLSRSLWVAKIAFQLSLRVQLISCLEFCTYRDSNPDPRLRRPVLYPLSYRCVCW